MQHGIEPINDMCYHTSCSYNDDDDLYSDDDTLVAC